MSHGARPEFPEPHPLMGIKRFMPLTFSAGNQVRILRNSRGTYFAAFPLFGKFHASYKRRRINLPPVDGGTALRGGQVIFPLKNQGQLLSMVDDLKLKRATLAWAQIKLRSIRLKDKQRRLRKGVGRQHDFHAGAFQEVFRMHFVLKYSAPQPHEPECFAGISLGPRKLFSVTILDKKGTVIEQRDWLSKDLAKVISSGEKRLRKLRTANKVTTGRTYDHRLKPIIDEALHEISEYLLTHRARICVQPVYKVRKRTKAHAINFLLSHWPYRQLIDGIHEKAVELGIPIQKATKSWLSYSFTCSSCGASNEGIKDPRKEANKYNKTGGVSL